MGRERQEGRGRDGVLPSQDAARSGLSFTGSRLYVGVSGIRSLQVKEACFVEEQAANWPCVRKPVFETSWPPWAESHPNFCLVTRGQTVEEAKVLLRMCYLGCP